MIEVTMPDATTTETTATREAVRNDSTFLRNRWYKHLQSRGQRPSDPETQALVQRMLDSGEVPQDGETRTKETPEFNNLDEFTDYMRQFASSKEALPDEVKGRADPETAVGAFILRSTQENWRNEDWSEFGWNTEAIRSIGDRLQRLFRFNNNQIRMSLQTLVSTGKTPTALLSELEQLSNISAMSEEAKQELKYFSDVFQQREYASQEAAEKAALLQKLGIRSEWIMKFILKDEFFDANERRFHDTMPNNIEDLAWQMSHQAAEFNLDGETPILEMRIVKKQNGEIDTENSRYYVNQGNMVLWVRKEMSEYFSLSPDSAHNFFEKVHLKKRFAPLSITDMFLNEGKYFTSENKALVYKELQRQLELEVWIPTVLRQFDIEYRTAYNIEDKLTEKINQLFYNSDITKHAYGKNMWYHMLTQPLSFESAKKEKGMVSDSKLGMIVNEMIMAYANFSDFNQLQDILGENSSFFTKRGMLDAVQALIKHQSQRLGTDEMSSFLGLKESELFLKAFDKQTGKVTAATKKDFVKFINFFTTQTPGAKKVPIIREALKNAMIEKYGTWNSKKGKYELQTKDGKTDSYSMVMADMAAISWWRFSGMGAINDTAFAGYDALSKVMNAEFYRAKMINRGNASGNPYTVSQFKRMVVDFMRGTQTLAPTQVTDERGKPLFERDKEGKLKAVMRNKTPYEVMMELRVLSARHAEFLKTLEVKLREAPTHEREAIEQQIAEINRMYQNAADQMTFNAEMMRDYAANHLDRGFKMYKLISSAEEADVLEKATRYDALRGVTFDRAKFQSEIQEKLFKQIRYLWNTYDELNFDMDVRVPALAKGTTSNPEELEFRTMKLGEALFGHQVLDRKMFWKVENGRYVMKDGKHVIDYTKVQKNKTQLWKNWALMKIAGDIHTHRALHSTDPGFNFTYYLNVIKAMEALPGDIMGDEFKMRNLTINNKLFSKADIAWLREISGATAFNIYTLAVLESLFFPKTKEGTGIGDAIGNFFKAISPNGQYY